MPIRPASAGRKTSGKRKDSSSTKKGKRNFVEEEIIDPRQEQIDGLIREQEQIRLKLNRIGSKIIENINIEDYQNDIDFTKQQPSDIALDHLLSMVDEICFYRAAFLNLIQETDDERKLSVQEKITQLSLEEPKLFRKFLTSEQRVTFVTRERDLWKENAQLLHMMYATIVDQLEMGVFQKSTPKTSDILQAHRLNLEDACRIFLSPSSRSLNERRTKKVPSVSEDQPVTCDLDTSDTTSTPLAPAKLQETIEQPSHPPAKVVRRVSFADKVNIIHVDQTNNDDESEARLPLASETLIDQMDSNLRMLIIKELSKDNHVQKPLSKMSSMHGTNINPYQQPNRSPKWVEFARLIGIDEPEIEHWLSQSLQYPAGRVISTWCNGTSPPPTVAELYLIISSNRLNRLDLARSIQTLYSI